MYKCCEFQNFGKSRLVGNLGLIEAIRSHQFPKYRLMGATKPKIVSNCPLYRKADCYSTGGG